MVDVVIGVLAGFAVGALVAGLLLRAATRAVLRGRK